MERTPSLQEEVRAVNILDFSDAGLFHVQVEVPPLGSTPQLLLMEESAMEKFV